MKTFKSLMICAVLSLVVLALVAPGAAAVPKKDDYKRAPGYVDFEAMNTFGDLQSTVEVFIKGPLLRMAVEAVREEEPELAKMLSGLKLIRVHVFEIDHRMGQDLIEKSEKLSKALEDKGWEMAVRVRQEEENVNIYMLPGKGDNIDGLVVMVVTDDDEAVFINVVGTIDPVQIGRIGHSFRIDALEDIDWEKKTRRERRRSRRDRNR